MKRDEGVENIDKNENFTRALEYTNYVEIQELKKREMSAIRISIYGINTD